MLVLQKDRLDVTWSHWPLTSTHKSTLQARQKKVIHTPRVDHLKAHT